MDRPEVDFRVLADELRSLFQMGVQESLDEGAFNDLALRIFHYQFEFNPVFGAFCRTRGQTPDNVCNWSDIPPIPTTAFKRLSLRSGGTEQTAVIFRTSGTTQPDEERGVHHVRDLTLYHGALLPNYQAHLVPGGGRMRTLSLIASPADQPESSLSHMVGLVMEQFGDRDGAYFVDRAGGLDHARFVAEVHRASSENTPVVVLGTAFAFVHLMDAMSEEGEAVQLPSGSCIMETGGFKGRSREVSRGAFYDMLGQWLGIGEEWIVNEYGMTELLSQFYDGIAGQAVGLANREKGHPRFHRPPPWVRSRVLDPVSLEPVTDGESGILAHLDLANLGTVCSLLTEDLGVAGAGGFRVLGRIRGAEPRGCSIAMDDLLIAIGSVR